MSINEPNAPFVGTIEKSPKISLIGTLAMLVEAPVTSPPAARTHLGACGCGFHLADVQEAVIGVTNVMLVFEQPPADIGMLSASIVELWHRVPSRKADGKLSRFP